MRSRPRQVGAFRFSETILGIDFSELYDYHEFRESREKESHVDRLCQGLHRRAAEKRCQFNFQR